MDGCDSANCLNLDTITPHTHGREEKGKEGMAWHDLGG